MINENYLKTDSDSKEPIYKFEIDPSLGLEYKSNQNLELVQYFWNKALSIDIWDAESLMPFGSVKVPLQDLIRNGRQQTTMTKEFDIIEPAFMRIKGSLQISFKNIGREPAKDVSDAKAVTMRNTMFSKTSSSKFMNQTQKKKVKSTTGINLPEQMKQCPPLSQFDGELLNHPEFRKQERINRYKFAVVDKMIDEKDNGTNYVGLNMNKEEILHEKTMKDFKEITNFRDTKKQFFLKSVLNQHYDEERYLGVSFGKTDVFSLEIANNNGVDEPYNICIEDPDIKYLNNAECQVVCNPEEWKFWIQKKGFSTPTEWNMIAQDPSNKGLYTIFLRKGEKCEVIFKFMTTRGIDNSDKNSIHEVNEEKKKLYISSRAININVSYLKGRIFTGLKINIEPHASVVDHVFRFFEQENRHVTLNLPAFYNHTTTPVNRPKLALTYDHATWSWINDKEITLEMTVPSAQSIIKFNLLAYNDLYFHDLIGNWVIEVYSCAG